MAETQEVLLAKLQQAVQGLSDREAEHHATVLSELKDIKEDLKPRLAILEQRQFSKSDFVEFYNKYAIELDNQAKEDKRLDERINFLRDKVNRYALILGIIWFIIVALSVAGWQYFLTYVQSRYNTPTSQSKSN
jgi:hypothetical protein